MKEITRVFTVELTQVSNFKNENEVLKADEAKDLLKIAIEGRFEFDNVNVVKVQDFIMEKNTKPKLTKRERALCDLARSGYITKDTDDEIWWSENPPVKSNTMWVVHGKAVCVSDFDEIDFLFIHWEDDKPWAVADLLKLEVE